MSLKKGLKYFCLIALLVGFALIFYSSKQQAEQTIIIGSKRFTESYILGEILKQTAEQTAEASVDYRPGMGNTGILYAALREGLIDIYPEYTGTIALEILKRADLSAAKPELLNAYLHPLHLEASPSLGFQDRYALAMKKERAQNLGIQTISDLAQHPELILGFSPEFIGRSDGWEGLKKSSYSFPQTKIKTIDHSLSYEALQQKKIDVMDTYTTDAKIEKYGLRLLVDDRHFFPSYEGVWLYRLESSRKFPKTWKAFLNLKHSLTTERMISLNAQAELQGVNFGAIAKNFLQEADKRQPLPLNGLWDQLWAPDLWQLTQQHLFLVFGALIPAIFMGIFLGIISNFWPVARHLILNVVAVVQTIPSLALLAFLIPVFQEIGMVPALVALFLYSLLPIVRNTYAGLANIPGSQQDSALALGLPFFYRLTRIELPLASRMILAGIKTAAVFNVGMATIAALIGAGGYGVRIVAGLALNDTDMLLAGAIPACILAICVQFGFDVLDYCLIPRGLDKASILN